MVKHVQSFNSSFYYKKFFSYLLLLSWAFTSPNSDTISYNFQDTPLKEAVKKLNNSYTIPIVFNDRLSNEIINASCLQCTPDDAISQLLSKTKLIYKLSGDQYIIFNRLDVELYSIIGRAIDSESGDPIPFANVFIPSLQIGDITGIDGLFNIANISVRSCTLSISYIGYNIQKIYLEFPKDNEKFLNIHILPKVLSSTDINIIGTKREFMDRSNSPGQISFSPKHIATLPNLGEVDIFRSLQLLPGIQLGLGGNSKLFIRGGSPDQNLVLLDGMPIYKTGHMFDFVSGINTNSIKDVQVYKGGYPVKYGGRVSSAIELTSKNGNSLKPHGSFYGNLMSQGISGEFPILSRGSFIINFRNSTTSKLQTGLYTSIQNFITGDDRFNLISENSEQKTTIYKPQFSYKDLTSRLSFLISPNNSITITKTTGQDSIIENRQFFGFADDLLFYDSTFINEFTEWKNNGDIFNLSSIWGPKWDTQLTISRYKYISNYQSTTSTKDSSNFIEIGVNTENNILNDQSIRFNNRYNGIIDHKLEFGIDESRYRTKFNNFRSESELSNNSKFEQKAYLYSFYFQDKWSFNTSTSIQSGFRFSYYSEYDNYYISPRLNIIKKLTNSLTLESSLGKYFQFIHQINSNNTSRGIQGTWVLSSKTIPVINSNNFHIGLNWDFNELSITSEFYYRYINDFFFFNSAPSILDIERLEQNLVTDGTGYARGFELLFRKQEGKITGWTAYQLNKTEYHFSEFNQGKKFLSDYDVTQEIKSVLMTKIGGWNLTANWVFASGRVYTNKEYVEIDNQEKIILVSNNINEERLNPIHHLDISIAKNWLISNIKIYSGLSIYNLYNKKNISHRRYNPYTSTLSSSDVSMFGITPTLFFKIRF